MRFLMRRIVLWSIASVVVPLLGACSSGVEKPRPVALGPDPKILAVKRSWTSSVGEIQYPMRLSGAGSEVAAASSQGTVVVVNARTGAESWRVSLNAPIEAGVGFDGVHVALVAQGGVLVVLKGGRESWRVGLGTPVITAPLVAGNRVFVLGVDRSVTAWDAASGKMLWKQTRSADPLVLKQSGVIAAMGDTLVVGQGAKLVGMNPLTGSIRWEQQVTNSRGTNEVEKLMDIPAGIAREGQQLCVRAYQHAIACIDAEKPSLVWVKPSNGHTGMSGDADNVFGADAQGLVTAYRRSTGEVTWTNNSLRFRQLTAPVVVGRSVAIGDAEGNVHLLSRADGSAVTRLLTDGTPVVSAPLLVGKTLVVATQRGGIFGFTPE